MARAFFRIIGIEGDGSEETPFIPRWMDRPEVEGFAACYKYDTQDRAIVLVEATVANLTTLSGLAGVTFICSLADLRNDVGTSRHDIRTAIRAYSNAPAAEWFETMVGNYRIGD